MEAVSWPSRSVSTESSTSALRMSNKFETYTVLHLAETFEALESALEALTTEPLLDELSGIARELAPSGSIMI